MIRILLAEGAQLLRGGLVALFESVPDLEVVASVDRGEQVLRAARRCGPDVALVDVGLPGLDGFSAACALKETVPECRTVLMAGRCRSGDLRRAVAAGAAGLVLKDTSPGELADAIRRAASGARVIDADMAFTELGSARGPLTEREIEVLALASRGATAAEIAEHLVLTIGTVRNHLSRINRKIGARNRVHAIRIAEDAGWL
ncbi:response regulator transcription factor [Actinomadura opuntiae]|uniref:response regulator transcription factor n=1 Tax=Actinomadura sp. OS1-43 TaxID=604315 RepID=UPI00255B29BA|nr:response regulator transcription factor [Actinomadura sp. OS1-43]MDL4819433.1 response regulator transcription factor [Actinomadura sp. OS1-43]